VEPEPYREGVRINSPHYLVKLIDDGKGPVSYTLVISQYEKYNSIYYTLRAYSTLPFQMSELKEPYNSKYSKSVIFFFYMKLLNILSIIILLI
jgi:calpain-7